MIKKVAGHEIKIQKSVVFLNTNQNRILTSDGRFMDILLAIVLYKLHIYYKYSFVCIKYFEILKIFLKKENPASWEILGKCCSGKTGKRFMSWEPDPELQMRFEE